MGLEDDPIPPMRPGPKRPQADPSPLVEGQSTFRPAPRPGARPSPDPVRAPANRNRAEGLVGAKEPRPEVGGPNWIERIVFGKVGYGHLASFCGQFATYQDAGVDILRSLTSLKRQFDRTALGPVIGRLEVQVRSGEPLADAMAREPQAFDKLCVAMMRVAGARGGEPETLRLLSKHYEARQRMIRQARSALIYPTIVLLIASAVVMLLAIFVLPKFAELLADLTKGKNVSLPLPSQILMGLSRFMTAQGWWLVPMVAVGGVFGLLWWYKTPAGKAMLDALSLYVPVLGKIRKKIETGRFARTLGALLNAGVDVTTSLDLTAGVLTLNAYRRAIVGVRRLVTDGTDLAAALDETRRFGPDVVAIVDSGEESGRLPEALDKLADDYEEQVEYLVKNLGNLVQPLLMIGLGAVVLFIILAVILPYIQMINSLTN